MTAISQVASTALPTKADLPRFSQSPSDQAFAQNPYPTYEKMRDLAAKAPANALFWEDYNLPVFARYAEVSALLRDRRFGREILHVATREELGMAPIPNHLEPFYAFEANSILEREPPVHTRLRKLINRAFTSRAIDGLAPRIAELSDKLLDELQSGDDLLAKYATPIPVQVIAELLGAPLDACDQMLRWSHDMVAMYQHNRDRTIEDAAVKATLEFSDFMAEVIEQRRKSPGTALIDDLIAVEEDGEKLSRDELITTAILLMNAGHEATVHGIANGVKSILEQNASRDIFGADTGALAADELLRIDPPLHMFTRYVLEDLDFNGLSLQKGDVVGLLLGSANHDPSVFADPSKLDLTRKNAPRHTSFGAGIHFCVGAPLARLEIRIALERLFARYPELALSATPTYADRYHFHGLEALHVRF